MQATDGNSQNLLLRARGRRIINSALRIAPLVFAFAIGIFLVARNRISKFKAPRNGGAVLTHQLLQQLSRVRTAEGKETIRGTLVAEFEQGERQVTLYVAFCPPFELLPQVEANAADDSEADVKIVQVLHNGAQIDVRLSEPAEELATISIDFYAVESDSAQPT